MDFNLIVSVSVLLLTYILIIWEVIPRVVTTLLGASLLVVLHVISQKQAFECVDFNVISLLVGMMILVNILSETGVLSSLAIWAAKSTGGDAVKLLLAFGTLSGLLSAFLDNVTTVLLLGNITCVITRRLKLNPVPYLICEAICSNVGGTATLIGDPPNIMIGSAGGLDFNAFLFALAPFIIIIFPAILGTLFLFYRNQLKPTGEVVENLLSLSGREAITDRPLLIKALCVIFFVFMGFIFHSELHLEAGTIAILGASILLIFENRKSIWNDVEWTTIFFFIGLFIIVGAVEHSGVLDMAAEKILELVKGQTPILTTITLLWTSAFCSAIVDNIPYTATMIPIVKSMQEHTSGSALWWALSLGACLGGNGSLIGATANVVVADIARSNGEKLGFKEFTLVGLIVTIETLLFSSLFLYLIQSGFF